MDIVLLRDAKELGLKYYFTGKPCKHGHICERIVSDRACLDCRRRIVRDYAKKIRTTNPEINREVCRRRYQSNKQEYINRARKWEQDNPERSADLQRQWRRSEKGKAQSRNWVAANKEDHYRRAKDWKGRHPELVAEYIGTRRATKLRATPPWLSPEDRAEIRIFYKEAKRLDRETGIKHHVDHIVPLQNEIVCGLHVPWNLQVLTESENTTKGNRFTK